MPRTAPGPRVKGQRLPDSLQPVSIRLEAETIDRVEAARRALEKQAGGPVGVGEAYRKIVNAGLDALLGARKG